MDDELKPCPFCGKSPKSEWHAWKGGTLEIACNNPNCQMMTVSTGLAEPHVTRSAWNARPAEDDEWNNRPVEDALRRQVEDLKVALKHLAARRNYKVNWDNEIDWDGEGPAETPWEFAQIAIGMKGEIMTSDELNQELSSIEVDKEGLFCAFGGKVLPYIGWYWRKVNFDQLTYRFGVIPPGADENTVPIVGFMEADKWDYPLIETTPQQWQEIKRLVISVVDNPSHDTLSALNDAIQRLADGWEFIADYSNTPKYPEWIARKKG